VTTVDDVLRRAEAAGVAIAIEGESLALDHDGELPSDLVAALKRFKPEILSTLHRREAVRQAHDRQRREVEERRAIQFWINDHFEDAPPGICMHCGGVRRASDPFVKIFVGNARGDVHAACHPPWLRAREDEARRALGLVLTAKGNSNG
jgi:hypothetical protein